ncbi:MAG: aldo/keto reductase [Oscillospiraceae bacterium]|nr:aldo/keto reductase [Oscillospiraceae bacterium]
MSNEILKKNIGKLGFGYMRLPQKDGGNDMEQIIRMADAFIEGGGTYFDAAFVYQGAEVALRESVIERYPRDSFQIATKLNSRFANSAQEAIEQHKTSLERLGTDYIDFYLIHGLNAGSAKRAEEFGIWDFFAQLKKDGRIGNMGFSFHGPPEELEEILTNHPEADFVQLQINYVDWDSPDVQSRKQYEVARKFNKPIAIMEPIKGGMLTGTESAFAEVLKAANPNISMAAWALRFAASLEGVYVTLSGMSHFDHVADNISNFVDFKPLTKEEEAILEKAVEAFNTVPRIPCTECRYCVDDCPSEIQIPGLIGLYNDYLVYKTTTNLARRYGMLTRESGKADECTSCKTCEGICPQQLEISDTMEKIAEIFA